MPTEPLNPRVNPLFGGRYAENTAGIVAAIVSCIQAAGGTVESYPANTAGVIQALIDLQVAISGGGTGTQSVAALAPGVAGQVLDKGDAVYISKADGKVYRAGNPFNRERATVLGLAKEAATEVDQGVTVVVRGPLEGLNGLSTGFEYYLGVDGQITTTAPVSGGVYSTKIGQALSSTKIDVQPGGPIYLV